MTGNASNAAVSQPVRIGDLASGRAGDKGDMLDLTLVARDADAYRKLERILTADAVQAELNKVVPGPVLRYEIAHLRALKFVLPQALPGGVYASLRPGLHWQKAAIWLLLDLMVDDDAIAPPPRGSEMKNEIGSFARSLDELRAAVGREAFVTRWVLIDQPRIDLFARATDDYQWIHVDPARARESDFGGTVAHGFLTLSLLGRFYAEHLTLPFATHGINYGLERVRFTAPVPAGSLVRARFVLADLKESGNSLQMLFKVTLEALGQDRPVCVAESIVRQYV